MKKTNRCYVDIHVLQTVPPSCVNRDDTGSPKTAVYGGVTRARVSSQAWKRAVRLAFREMYEPEQLGTRTKQFISSLAKCCIEQKPDLSEEDAIKLAKEALVTAGAIKKTDKKKNSSNKNEKEDEDSKSDVWLFFSKAQFQKLAALALSGEKKKELFSQALKENPSIEQALFGRMVAADSKLNYDAAAQVAHSISTHAVQNEFDFFTGWDDEAEAVGHLGTKEYNSATLYRFATVNVGELSELLKTDSIEAVKRFVKAFCESMPQGNKSSFAPFVLPDAVYIAVRGDQPVNLVGAFERPVQARGEGYLAASEAALVAYSEKVYENFAARPLLALGASNSGTLPPETDRMNLSQVYDRLEAFLSTYLTNGEAAR